MNSYFHRRTPRLGFVNAKESHKKERMLGSQHSSNNQTSEHGFSAGGLSEMILRDRNKEYEKYDNNNGNPQDGKEDRGENQFRLLMPEPSSRRDQLALHSQRSSDGGPFAILNVGEITKAINPSICRENGDDMEHLLYDENNQRISSSNELPGAQAELASQTLHQNNLLKRLNTLRYDEETSCISQIRQSVYNKSLSKKHKAHLLLMQNEEDSLQKIPEVPEQSRTFQQPFQLQDYEELFFHYLSILALLAEKRIHFHNILDTYLQRSGPQKEKEDEKEFNFYQEWERRNKQYETLIEIPDEAKLLRANTMLLQLYVSITQEGIFTMNGLGLQQQKNRHLKYDRIYE